MNILMVASENDAIPAGKVGGIGDVVRDIPPALAECGHEVHVVTPGYGAFSTITGAVFQGSVKVAFAGSVENVDLFSVPAKHPHEKVMLWVLEHPLFAAGGVGSIYCDDPPSRPFATDASKFALFSASVCQAIEDSHFGALDVLHLHDWHASTVAILRAFDPLYANLQNIHCVFTIHNLALQGIRPLAGDASALHTWFPQLQYDADLIQDPRVTHCVNLMRAGINLCDRVHAVSPTYAQEIQIPSNIDQGFFGGEGLEDDLKQAAADGRLHGILNGCEYPQQAIEKTTLVDMLLLCERQLLEWIAARPGVESTHVIALHNLQKTLASAATKKLKVLTSVGRVTEQKVLILQQQLPEGQSALEQLLDTLGGEGMVLMLGSGDNALEMFLTRVAARKQNFIFLKGYSEYLADLIYENGDLFLMPSSFEPCGISQMLAMRSGQPCLVHGVGGLLDTVEDNKNGFIFSGKSMQEQAVNMLEMSKKILKLYDLHPAQWNKISKQAAKERFSWSKVAEAYTDILYSSKK